MRSLLTLFISCFILSTSWAQPASWGEAVRGIQFGLVVKEDRYSYLYEVYVRCQDPGAEVIYMSRKQEYSFFISRYGDTYEVKETRHKNLTTPQSDGLRIYGKVYDRGWPVRCGDEYLINSYVIPKILAKEFPCKHWLDVPPDTAYFKVSTLLPNISSDTAIYYSNKALIPYCPDKKNKAEAYNDKGRFLDIMINHPNGTPLEVASKIASDTLEDELFRGIAGHLLANINSEESRQVLWGICSNPRDKDLRDMISCFFDTGDIRYRELIDRYHDHPDDEVQQEIAWAIGHFKSKEHFPILLDYAGCEVRYTRRIATQSLKYFDNKASRKALHLRLTDTDFMIRSDAVYSLLEVGDKSSILPLYGYVQLEYPTGVGYYQNAMKVIEKISGEQFENDFEKLKTFMLAFRKE